MVKTVESHMQCEKDKNASKSHKRTQKCPQKTLTTSTTSTDLRAAIGLTQTLKSEVSSHKE